MYYKPPPMNKGKTDGEMEDVLDKHYVSFFGGPLKVLQNDRHQKRRFPDFCTSFREVCPDFI